MDDFSAFTEGERALLEALTRRGVPFIMVGLSAAVLQGANCATRDIDLWFADLNDPRIREAAREAHAIWIPGTFGMRPPQFGGHSVGDRLDVVTHMHGLATFNEELANTREIQVDGLPLRVLQLERILASKQATGRPKDLAAIPALEEAIAASDGSPDA
ncbi:MAG: nucleotidyltransferase [Myxococcales bacterium]|nr:nucleotidyltransferase [Myxococcales bacterium]